MLKQWVLEKVERFTLKLCEGCYVSHITNLDVW